MTRAAYLLAGAVLLPLLAGCNVSAAEIECCAELCAGNGGVAHIVTAPNINSPTLASCECGNEAYFGRPPMLACWQVKRSRP